MENLICPICLRQTDEQIRECAYCGKKYSRKHGLEEDDEEPEEDSPVTEGMLKSLLNLGK